VSAGWRVRFFYTVLFTAFAPSRAADAVWLDVPFVAQEKNGCGSAALAMLIRYWGREADAARIQRELYSPAEKGIPAAAMKSYLERQGFRAYAFSGEWQDLLHHLSLGRPLIVCLKPSRRAALHYAVAAGVAADAVALNDPADRKLRKWERGEFEKSWRAADSWTLLAVPQAGP
jgi:ABC-type bacteriocin/lantibiotic exporter with double-glycine peptidase domain